LVYKIFFKDGIWKIQVIKNKKRFIFYTKYLFLCAGAIETFKILRISNIKVKQNISNYKLHPMIKVIAEFESDVQVGKENVHPYQVTEFFPKFIIGEAASGKRFLKMSVINNNKLFSNVEKNWKKMSIYHVTFSLGLGKVFKIPFYNKFIYSYKIEENDAEILQKGYIQLCQILFAGKAKKINLITKKIQTVNKDNYISKIKNLKSIGDFKISSVHLLGGIGSGEDKDKCAVDSFGKLKGYKNLYINDSSLIDHKLLKNPQGTIMAIAKRNIDSFISKK
jgi:choline dehydrogenase-like flavoprotein